MSKQYVEIDENTGLFKFPNVIHSPKPDGVVTAEIDTDDCCHLNKYIITKDGDNWVATPMEVNRAPVAEAPKKKDSGSVSSVNVAAKVVKEPSKRGRPKKKMKKKVK